MLAGSLSLSGCMNDSDVKDSDDNNASDEEIVVMQVALQANMSRDMGWGTCGTSPWNKGCATSRTWWGYDLENFIIKNLIIVPDGENRWVLTNNQDALEKYAEDHDINLEPFSADMYYTDDNGVRYDGGKYQKAAIDFSVIEDCSGSVDTELNYAQIMGEVVDNNIELVFSIDAKETENGVCTNYPFSYNVTNWRWAVSSVLTGDTNNMTINLTDAENTPAAEEADKNGIIDYNGTYYKEFSGDTNPSPQNRDHVAGNITLTCMKYRNGEPLNSPDALTNCPWNEIIYQ